MGLFHRLFGAADRDGKSTRSTEEARPADMNVLVAELRALIKEIRQDRESSGNGRGRISAENRPRRGGRGRGSAEGSHEGGSFSNRGQRKGLPKAPPEDAPTGLLVDYLRTKKLKMGHLLRSV